MPKTLTWVIELFDGMLDGEQDLDLLRFEVIPALAVLFPYAEDPGSTDPKIWLQQDGAPPECP